MGDMDSGNSGGSMQSSSTGGGGGGGGGGDDQEYESRGGGTEFFNPMSAFNLDSLGGGGAAASPLQLYSFSNGSSSFPHHNHQLVSNYFDHPTASLDQCPNFMLNHHNNDASSNNNNSHSNDGNQFDMVWPNKFAPSIRPPHMPTDDANCTAGVGVGVGVGYTLTNNPQQPPPPPPVASSGTITSSNNNNTGSGRNPKKRSRASRRAPTTVLTTDTSNFRQMVQEFTGIPAPPFTGFSTRARFDLFNGLGLGLGSGQGHSNPSVPTPSYLLRPFAQKIPPLHQPPFSANSSSLPNPTQTTTTSNIISNTNNNTSPATVAPASATFNLHDPDQSFINTNPQLAFQPGLIGHQPASSALAQQESSVSLTTTTTSTTSLPHQTSCSVNPAHESYRGISTNTDGAPAANGALVNNGGTTKGEGMVDSWICSSD